MQKGRLALLAAQSQLGGLGALGHRLMYFIRGKHPWQDLKAKGVAKYLF